MRWIPNTLANWISLGLRSHFRFTGMQNDRYGSCGHFAYHDYLVDVAVTSPSQQQNSIIWLMPFHAPTLNVPAGKGFTFAIALLIINVTFIGFEVLRRPPGHAWLSTVSSISVMSDLSSSQL